jgi:hypothetical protein
MMLRLVITNGSADPDCLPPSRAGTLGLVVTFVHGLLGETRVFARARIEPARLRRLIQLVWHCSAVARGDVAALLIAAPLMGSQMARHWIVGAAVVIYGFGAVANAWAIRGRHFGWARVDNTGRLGCCRAVMHFSAGTSLPGRRMSAFADKADMTVCDANVRLCRHELVQCTCTLLTQSGHP